MATISLAFAALALVLSCVGIYGVLSYITARRTQEIGIRVVLGANARTVVTGVLADSLELALLGIIIGAIVAVVVTRTVASLLYGVAPLDPATMIVGAALILATAIKEPREGHAVTRSLSLRRRPGRLPRDGPVSCDRSAPRR